MATAAGDGNDGQFLVHTGPTPGIRYPLQVLYCEECDGWPVEYLEHYPNQEKAKAWMQKNLSDDMKKLYLDDGEEGKDGDAEGGEEKKKKRQHRGGRGVIKEKKKQAKPQQVCLSRAPRGKKKYVTVITGLATYEIDLKDASKYFATKFSCGSSVTGPDEIVIQGDCKDDLWDVIAEKWSQIDEDCIEDLGDQKRS